MCKPLPKFHYSKIRAVQMSKEAKEEIKKKQKQEENIR